MDRKEKLEALLAEKRAAIAAAAEGAPSPERKIAPPAARPVVVPAPVDALEVAAREKHSAIAVRPVRPSALVIPGIGSMEGIDGMENVDHTDLILPARYLAQALSTKLGDAPVGTFYDNLTETWKDSIELVILRFGRGMIFYDAEDRQAPALCGSNDGLLKREEYNGLNDFGPNCLTCPMAQWVRYEDGSSTPPPCKVVRSFFCIEEDEDGTVMPFVYSCMKTASKPARKLISFFVMGKKPFYSNHVTLSSKMAKGPKGEWPIPVFTIGRATDRKKYARIFADFEGVELKPDALDEEPEERRGSTPAEDWDPPGFDDQPEMSEEDKKAFEKHLSKVLED